MGQINGFIEFSREMPQKKDPLERIKNYNEFESLYTSDQLHQQSARCMNCGVPFCHSGCPLGNIIPKFNDAVYRENWEEAYKVLSMTNNFPEFTGRICPAPCESACVLGINKPPVAIEEIEKHIIEIAFEKGIIKPIVPAYRTGKKVAIVGSGPAGLAVAAQLNTVGHLVTVYERDDAPGGLLRYGIPDFKLEKSLLDRRIQLMKDEGIFFQVNCFVGESISMEKLLLSYDAIVLAGGSTVPRNLNVSGRELKGVYFAMEFLKQQNKRNASKDFLKKNNTESNMVDVSILATNKDVVVIGGGDTGSDCVGTSNRQGAKSVTQFELLPKPPEGRTPFMPWPTYPMILKTTSSHEEGCQRYWGLSTKSFVGDELQQLKALRVVELEWKMNDEGKAVEFVEVPNSEREIPCQLVLLAMGFLHPYQKGMVESLGIELDERGNVNAKEGMYQTNIEKIFVAGDMRRGQSLVVWAISEGRECATQVDAFLSSHHFSLLEKKDATVIIENRL